MLTLLIWVSAGTAALLESSYAQSLAYERPIHTIVLSFLSCSILLVAIERFYPQAFTNPVHKSGLHGELPLEDWSRTSTSPSKEVESDSRVVGRRRLGLVGSAICILVFRIELWRKVLNTSQCASRSVEVFLPLLLALNDWRCQECVQLSPEEDPDSSVYDGIRASIKQHLMRPAWRYVPPAFLVSAGCYTATGLWSGLTSTFICPVSSGEAAHIPRLQQCALVLDAVLAVIADELSRSNIGSHQAQRSVTMSYGAILFGAACVWSCYAALLAIVRPEYRYWLLLLDTPSTATMLVSIFKLITTFSIFFVATTYCIMTYGVFNVSMLLTTLLTIVPSLKFVWSTRHPFPPTTSSASFWAFFVIYAGLWSFYRIRQVLGVSLVTRSSSWLLLPLLILVVFLFPGMIKGNNVHFHPIDLLMYDARGHHDRYVNYASYSHDLDTATRVYRGRYESEPPPGFDVWWEYAQNRSSLITDDYDQIFLDLLPFRTTSPADLRRQTWEMTSNPWNEISGITIRDGKAEVQENVLPTHRWMLEGVAIFINSFAQYLPDMDLAFNLNDESRVAMPYRQITNLRQNAKKQRLDGRNSWSGDRKSSWLPIGDEEYTSTDFENWSFQNTFSRFGSAGCAPNSPARSQAPHLSQSYLCTDCVSPHSMAQFVSDWTLAADPCHQPDLALLHGFYSSPAAFKTTRQLFPVFSQSKAHGYNDILYPSAWNYMDKIKYSPSNATGTFGTDEYQPGHPDVPFAEKINDLYWRGATSEGVSPGSRVWRGMTRQRLVHMANNLTNSHHDHATVLLPAPNVPKGFSYQTLSAQTLVDLGIQTDVQLVDHIARCGGADCTDQEIEFGLGTPIDFQSHWQHRFLFDMDGAGFSGRFLPFLQSHSLPFKTAIFREWYDSRLTAWRHFVPQDIRLHGVWSTLAYFAGVDGIVEGKRLKWEGHVEEAELIAEQGREWAGQVLRKEDMEIYFFRLLLEWARLTDDRRDELGYSPN